MPETCPSAGSGPFTEVPRTIRQAHDASKGAEQSRGTKVRGNLKPET
jgi:hypothetical protein